jgi:hypothetical protein
MKPLNYRQARPWLLALAAVVACSLVLVIAILISGFEQRAAAVAFVWAATAIGWVVVRNERLYSWRRFAREDLDCLREELRQAAAGEGENYEWVLTMPYRPSFTELLSNTTRDVGSLELEAQSLEETMRNRFFWQSSGSLCSSWDMISFRARRSVESMSDKVFWRSIDRVFDFPKALSKAYEEKRGPRLRLVVNNA